MDHAAHDPGTVEGCEDCRALSYEPGWYRAMRRDRARDPGPVMIPEVGELPFEVVLPDLDAVRRENEGR